MRHGPRVILSGLADDPVRQPDRAGRSERIGQDHAAAGDRRVTPSGGRPDRPDGLRSADIALLAQGSHLDRSFPITCHDVVALAATRLGPFRSIGKDRRAATKAALDRVGLAEMENRPIQALSAGQFQRVLFARTIVQEARVILLDEPFTSVDAATTDVLMSVIEDWHAQGRMVIAVLHDMTLVRRHFRGRCC